MSAVGVQPTPARGALARTVGRRVTDWAPAAAVLVLGLVAWQGLVAAFNVQQFLLPKPTEIASAFWDDRHTLWSAGWFTFQEALGGFAIGSTLGIVVALLFASWPPLGGAFMPYAVAANAIPIIASTLATFKAVKMYGSAVGKRTRRKISSSLAA